MTRALGSRNLDYTPFGRSLIGKKFQVPNDCYIKCYTNSENKKYELAGERAEYDTYLAFQLKINHPVEFKIVRLVDDYNLFDGSRIQVGIEILNSAPLDKLYLILPEEESNFSRRHSFSIPSDNTHLLTAGLSLTLDCRSFKILAWDNYEWNI